MTLEPLLDAPVAVQIHVAAVVPAALLGAYQLARRKGTPSHRLLGRIWLALMALAALSSFFIHTLNMVYGFSPIHLISIYVLYGCWGAIAAVRRGDIAAHRRAVRGMYFGGIVIAGLFTLVPGRIMNLVVFSGGEILPVLIAAAILAFFGWLTLTRHRGSARAA